MKNSILILLSLSVALLCSCTKPEASVAESSGEGKAETQPTPTAQPATPAQADELTLLETPDGAFLKVATIEGSAAIEEFQKNVTILQTQRKLIIDLKDQMDNETDAAKKAELEKELEAGLAKLNENSDFMAKNYGFSLLRNYVMNIEESRMFMQVTPEELKLIQSQQQQE